MKFALLLVLEEEFGRGAGTTRPEPELDMMVITRGRR